MPNIFYLLSYPDVLCQELGKLFPKQKRTVSALPYSTVALGTVSISTVNESEYGRQIAVLVQKFEEDLFTYPLLTEGFVRGLRRTSVA